MDTIKSRDARAHFSTLLRSAEQGRTTRIERYDKPVARVAPWRPNLTDPLMSSLRHCTRTLTARGRTAAAAIRGGETGEVPTLYAVEADLTELLRALGSDEGPINLDGDVHEGESRAEVARRWARLACRGYDLQALYADRPNVDYEPASRLSDVLAAAGVSEDRYQWTGGIDTDEAERACAALGVGSPVPLVNIDALPRSEDAGDW